MTGSVGASVRSLCVFNSQIRGSLNLVDAGMDTDQRCVCVCVSDPMEGQTSYYKISTIQTHMLTNTPDNTIKPKPKHGN